MEILNNFDNSQGNSESFFFFIKLTLLQFILTNFWKQNRWSGRRSWRDKCKVCFWHFPSHWPASRAISLPFRLKCCFWALKWYLACWHKLHSSKIATKRISVESNPEILVASQYRFYSAPRVPGYWLSTKIPGFDSTEILFVEIFEE